MGDMRFSIIQFGLMVIATVGVAEPLQTPLDQAIVRVEAMASQARTAQVLLSPEPTGLRDQYYQAIFQLYGGMDRFKFDRVADFLLASLRSDPSLNDRMMGRREGWAGRIRGFEVHPSFQRLEPAVWRQVANSLGLPEILAEPSSAQNDLQTLARYELLRSQSNFQHLPSLETLAKTPGLVIFSGDRPTWLLRRKDIEDRVLSRPIHELFAPIRSFDCLSGCTVPENLSQDRAFVPLLRGAKTHLLFWKNRWIGHMLDVPFDWKGALYSSLEPLGDELVRRYVSITTDGKISSGNVLDAWIAQSAQRPEPRSGYVVGTNNIAGRTAQKISRTSAAFAGSTVLGDASFGESVEPYFESAIAVAQWTNKNITRYRNYQMPNRLLYEVTVLGADTLRVLKDPTTLTDDLHSENYWRTQLEGSKEQIAKALSRLAYGGSIDTSVRNVLKEIASRPDWQIRNSESPLVEALNLGGSSAIAGYLFVRSAIHDFDFADVADVYRMLQEGDAVIKIMRFTAVTPMVALIPMNEYAIKQFLSHGPPATDVLRLLSYSWDKLHLREVWSLRRYAAHHAVTATEYFKALLAQQDHLRLDLTSHQQELMQTLAETLPSLIKKQRLDDVIPQLTTIARYSGNFHVLELILSEIFSSVVHRDQLRTFEPAAESLEMWPAGKGSVQFLQDRLRDWDEMSCREKLLSLDQWPRPQPSAPVTR